MIATRRTVARMLNRLPTPRRATLADLGHAAALLARGQLAPQPHTVELAARLAELEAWLTATTTAYARPTPTTKRSTKPAGPDQAHPQGALGIAETPLETRCDEGTARRVYESGAFSAAGPTTPPGGRLAR